MLTAFAHADKCEFHITSCEYLGYMLSPDGLTIAQNKVQIIQDWPKPRKVKDIQSFLGFANFYHHFIYEYSRIVIPLTHLTRKTTNQTLEQYIRVYCNYQQDNCDELLPLAEFAYNNAPSATTGRVLHGYSVTRGIDPTV